jgi:hypothetical protein
VKLLQGGGRRLEGLDECRAGELFERQDDEDLDVFQRTGRGALNPPKPLVRLHGRPRLLFERKSEPLTRTTVLFVLAAAVCAGLAAALV